MDEQSLISRSDDTLLSPLDDTEFLAAIYASGSDLSVGIPMPFADDTFLIGLEIAGTNHIENIHELFDKLEIGERVILFREPSNPYDERAILVLTQYEDKLGYIPRSDNLILSRLMDAGYSLYALVRKKELDDNDYHRIVIKVFLTGGTFGNIKKVRSSEIEDSSDESICDDIQSLDNMDRLALLKTGIHANQNKKYRLSSEAMKRFLESDESNNLYNQAVKYYKGMEGEVSFKEAAYWAQKSVDAGYIESYVVLFAVYFYGGNDLEKDPKLALKYCRLGAEKGEKQCQYNLGLYYIRGDIVEKDIEKAIYWLEKASDNGSFPASHCLLTIYDEDSEFGLYDKIKAFKAAVTAYHSHSYFDNDNENAFIYVMYYIGISLYEDVYLDVYLRYKGNAFYYLNRAAEEGHDGSQFQIGIMYLTGDECEKDVEKAKEWIDKAAEQGYEDAIKTKNNGYVLPDDIAEEVNKRFSDLKEKEERKKRERKQEKEQERKQFWEDWEKEREKKKFDKYIKIFPHHYPNTDPELKKMRLDFVRNGNIDEAVKVSFACYDNLFDDLVKFSDYLTCERIPTKDVNIWKTLIEDTTSVLVLKYQNAGGNCEKAVEYLNKLTGRNLSNADYMNIPVSVNWFERTYKSNKFTATELIKLYYFRKKTESIAEEINECRNSFHFISESEVRNFVRAYLFALQFEIGQFNIILGSDYQFDKDVDIFIEMQRNSLRCLLY